MFTPYTFIKVLSEQVAKAMEFKDDDSLSETIRFVRMMDKLFDILNVNNFTKGKHQLKAFQDPYISNDDFRLSVSSSFHCDL